MHITSPPRFISSIHLSARPTISTCSPLRAPFLIATSPTVISQFTQWESHLPNHPGGRKYLLPITGGGDLASMEVEEWKRWRKIYNPGFSCRIYTDTGTNDCGRGGDIRWNVLKEHARKGDRYVFVGRSGDLCYHRCDWESRSVRKYFPASSSYIREREPYAHRTIFQQRPQIQHSTLPQYDRPPLPNPLVLFGRRA